MYDIIIISYILVHEFIACQSFCSKYLSHLLQIFSRVFAQIFASNSTKILQEACRPPTTRLMLSSPPPGTLLVNVEVHEINLKLILNSSYLYLGRGRGGGPASAPGARHLCPGPRRPRHRPHTRSPLPPGPKTLFSTSLHSGGSFQNTSIPSPSFFSSSLHKNNVSASSFS